MCLSSKSTSSTFSPDRNVLSMTRPWRMCLSFVRTNAQPLPELGGRHLHRALTLPFQARAQGAFQSRACVGVVRLLAQDPNEDVEGLLGEALVEAQGAERGRHERVVGEHTGEAADLAVVRRSPQEPE